MKYLQEGFMCHLQLVFSITTSSPPFICFCLFLLDPHSFPGGKSTKTRSEGNLESVLRWSLGNSNHEGVLRLGTLQKVYKKDVGKLPLRLPAEKPGHLAPMDRLDPLQVTAIYKQLHRLISGPHNRLISNVSTTNCY